MKGFLAGSLQRLLGASLITSSCSYLLNNPAIVLMYHDLREDGDYESWLKVSRTAFTQQLEALSRFCDFIEPNDVMGASASRSSRLRVLLTFDDGFVNNKTIALPILEKFGAPALFFISTENMETGSPFWFDLVITPIQHLRLASLDLCPVGLKRYDFPQDEGPRRWSVIQSLLTDIKTMGNGSCDRVNDILRFFQESYGSSIENSHPRIRPLTRDEIKAMKQSGFCHFGSHSHRHDILTYLDEHDVRDNLLKSKRLLEEVTGEPIVHISYPNGDTTAAIETMSRECGYEWGYGTQPGAVTGHTAAMRIPRVAVSGYDSLCSLGWNINRVLMR
ncbi:MAG: polysaccharide deacetylase family protein, partial [Deltaproteobacteria bacterium]|nr:polysaccharide deacetylase family protein [Deltaproteobacteria bacterium]